MLLEVGGHGRVASQSLTRALQASVTLHDPGAAAGVFAQHAAAAGRRRDSAVGYRGAHRQNFGLLAPGGEVGVVALKHAADVVQEVVEELGDALVTWKYRHEKQTVRTLLPMALYNTTKSIPLVCKWNYFTHVLCVNNTQSTPSHQPQTSTFRKQDHWKKCLKCLKDILCENVSRFQLNTILYMLLSCGVRQTDDSRSTDCDKQTSVPSEWHKARLYAHMTICCYDDVILFTSPMFY